jgi:KaiC/GvpD/RAD55 family RecA-like ATPase
VKGPDGKLDFNELGKLLVHRVAYATGMGYDEAKKALMGITGLSVKELEERVKEIEGKIEELEKKLELIRQERRAGIETADVGEFAKGGIYPNVRVENGELRVRVEDGYHSIVRAGKFNELVNEVRDRLLKQGFVVVVGPKGIGKSTLAAAVIWELFMNGDIGLVARVDALDSKNYSEFTTFIENYSREFGKYFGRLLILYDPVSTKAYERADIDMEAPIQANIERTIKDLVIAINSISYEAPKPLALIVIPSDIYNALSEKRRNELKKYRLDVSQDLIDTEFLAELIREYTRTKSNPNGCALSDEELSELAGKVAGFDSGHALIARLIGEELARSNCDLGKIGELISKAKGKAEAFIILHINGLFKVYEDPDTAKALVEIFALRKPFINSVRPGGPILTPGIIGLIGEERGAKTLYAAGGGELRGWLALRQHDLIEDSIGKLLKCVVSEGEECKELGDAWKPWMETHAPEIRSRTHAVKYFVRKYGKGFVKKLRRHKNCWKRAALIIGFASAGRVSVHRLEGLPESLRRDVAESLRDALRKCDADYYLLVGNKIPPLIWSLTRHHAYALAEAFVDKYDEAVAEIKRVLYIAGRRSIIYDVEGFYGLGLSSIIAKAVEPGKLIEPGDAGAVLHIVSYIVSLNIQHAGSLSLVKPMLIALVPLRDKAPQRYLEVLAFALDRVSGPDILGFILGFMCPDFDTVRYILNEFDYILNKYGDGVKGHAWTLVRAIGASINSLYGCLVDCDDFRDYWDAPYRTELERIASRVAGLLNEVDRLNPSLDIFAWAHALLPALDNKCVRALMESVLGVDVVNKKAKEIAGGLSGLRESVQELIRDEDFMGFVESWLGETGEKAARRIILKETSNLKYAWALYKLDNDELHEAEELFNEAARERREIGDYQRYLDYSNWALRAKAIRSKLAGDELVRLVDEFGQLYEEAKKQPDTILLRNILGRYLVSLALKGGDEEIRRIEELLREKCREPERYLLDLDLIRPTLYALLGLRDESSGELKDRLCVKPEMRIIIYGPEDRYIKSQGDLRQALTNYFQRWISNEEVLDLLKKLSLDAESLKNELEGLIHELSGKSLPELAMFSSCSKREQRRCLSAHLTYMLYALIDGNEKLAKAHALYGAASVAGKLPARLFLEAYKECCDLKSESFRRAIARLFFLHV